MYREVGVHGGAARLAATGFHDQAFAEADCRSLSDECFRALPIIEISDKDYRSFCWPCHALEEPADRQ